MDQIILGFLMESDLSSWCLFGGAPYPSIVELLKIIISALGFARCQVRMRLMNAWYLR